MEKQITLEQVTEWLTLTPTCVPQTSYFPVFWSTTRTQARSIWLLVQSPTDWATGGTVSGALHELVFLITVLLKKSLWLSSKVQLMWLWINLFCVALVSLAVTKKGVWHFGWLVLLHLKTKKVTRVIFGTCVHITCALGTITWALAQLLWSSGVNQILHYILEALEVLGTTWHDGSYQGQCQIPLLKKSRSCVHCLGARQEISTVRWRTLLKRKPICLMLTSVLLVIWYGWFTAVWSYPLPRALFFRFSLSFFWHALPENSEIVSRIWIHKASSSWRNCRKWMIWCSWWNVPAQADWAWKPSIKTVVRNCWQY